MPSLLCMGTLSATSVGLFLSLCQEAPRPLVLLWLLRSSYVGLPAFPGPVFCLCLLKLLLDAS